ncbi:transcription initiation factor TFIID subunit 3-like isoform X2 [Eriocheir sinensis]|uniref:transcription initiation factor TFIID subunit 3-like isoform X2 n=1 Tax=Eriocheir sinensis TaxID=95602 RepID=UPI0021C8D645|nr:transcription initiation factor TFIID subunit 3-like isoform X2 [Eriocheir sinensis]
MIGLLSKSRLLLRVCVKMIRRGGGRAPPVILILLLVLLAILGFNYWLLSSQHADLQQELEKMQAEVKISAVKQDQSEKKNAALQETVHEMDAIADKLKKRLQEDEESIKNRDQDGQKKDYEITSLRNKIVTLQEQINTVKQQVEEQEVELAKAKETSSHLGGERDAALEAVADKDTLINTLKMQLEQEKRVIGTLQYAIADLKNKVTQTFGDLSECQDKIMELENKVKAEQEQNEKQNQEHQEAQQKQAQNHAQELDQVKKELAVHQREQRANAQPQLVPGPMNLPGIENKEPYLGPGQLGYVPRSAVRTVDKGLQGITFHRDLPILPRDPPDAPRAKPRFSVVAAPQNPLGGLGVVPKPPEPPVNAAPEEPKNPQVQPPVAQYLQPIPVLRQHYQGLAKPRHALHQQGKQFIQRPRLPPIAGPAVMERPAAPVAEGHHPLVQPVDAPDQPHEPQNDVLAAPPAQGQDQQRVDDLARSKRGNNLEGGQGNGNIFEPLRSAAVAPKPIDKPISLHDKNGREGKDGAVMVGLDHGQADTEDKNDAQEQLDEPPQPHVHRHVENEDHEDHNNALEQVEDEDEEHHQQQLEQRLPREP